jgi:glycosyltransferase involved in cell wall biosynthesis
MRIGIIFHKNPYAPPKGIDLVRLRNIAGGLIRRGIDAEIIAPVEHEGIIDGLIPVRRLKALREVRYDVLKTSYHDSILIVGDFDGPIVSRIVRVVDDKLPERDEPFRKKLIQCQDIIAAKASAVVLNNEENASRWRGLYGNRQEIAIIGTGCPSVIPELGANPYGNQKPAILFLGSIASERMLRMLNTAAKLLENTADIHLVGLNKVRMYGGQESIDLEPGIKDHGEIPEPLMWDYVKRAHVGIALAAGPHLFDNDISKIWNYLRGGLPVLAEERIINNVLIEKTGLGRVFRFDSPEDMALQALEMLETDYSDRRAGVMNYMAEAHSWEKRVESYLQLFARILKA